MRITGLTILLEIVILYTKQTGKVECNRFSDHEMMTHEEKIEFLRSLPYETISPTELALVLGGNPYSYNLAAKQEKIPYPYLWRGRNLRIIKQPILDELIGKNAAA